MSIFDRDFSKIVPSAFLNGSLVQAVNVLEAAIKEIELRKADIKPDIDSVAIWRRCENVLRKLKDEAAIYVDNTGSDYHMGRCEALGDALDAIAVSSYAAE